MRNWVISMRCTAIVVMVSRQCIIYPPKRNYYYFKRISNYEQEKVFNNRLIDFRSRRWKTNDHWSLDGSISWTWNKENSRRRTFKMSNGITSTSKRSLKIDSRGFALLYSRSLFQLESSYKSKQETLNEKEMRIGDRFKADLDVRFFLMNSSLHSSYF